MLHTRILKRSFHSIMFPFHSDGVPRDCGLLVIGQLSAPLPSDLVTMVTTYINNGGRVWLVGSACTILEPAQTSCNPGGSIPLI